MTDRTQEDPDVDVVVVGAGPTGLLVASELALRGVGVVVLERRDRPSETIKAGSINVATAEILDRRGLRPQLRAAHRRTIRAVGAFVDGVGPAGGVPGRSRPSLKDGPSEPEFPATGHFAGLFFDPDLVDRADPEIVGHAGAGGSTLVRQADLEVILTRHCEALGVQVRRGVEVVELEQHDASASSDGFVRLATSAGPVRARWVVGADGGHSIVRKLAGIAFPGTDAEITGYQAIADLRGTEALGAGWNHTSTGVYCHGPIPGRILTVQFTGPPADRSAPVTREELQASIRLVSGADVTVAAIRGVATRWTDNARQAADYRAGRVLVAGDAAHVHSPFSGQGLNLGAGDAINLGWKLAATIQGWAPEGLLDTYHAERHPIGADVLDWTRAQVALMRTDEKTDRLREVVARELLGTEDGTTRTVLRAAGLAQRCATAGDAAAHPLGGRLIGDVPLATGGRLAHRFHDGRFVLVDRTASAELADVSAAWAARVAVVHEPGRPSAGAYGRWTGVLVRPDGVVVWAQDADHTAPDVAGLRRALERWAGTPMTAVRAACGAFVSSS